MSTWFVDDARRETGGSLLWGSPLTTFTTISTDTRSIRPGSVFVALQGPKFDGNSFAAEALAKGASGIIVSADPDITNRPAGSFALLVPDTLAALCDLASYRRRQLDPTVISVSGSCGKTTTKDMIAAILSSGFRTIATEGNKNNLVGLPLTLFRLGEEDNVAVVELGMNQRGEMKQLAQIAAPDIAVITNMAEAHIGNFTSLEDCIAGEAEVLEGIPNDSVVVANADDDASMKAIEACGRSLQIMSFGIRTPADVMAQEIERIDPIGYRIHIAARRKVAVVELPLFGRFHIYNALAAITASLAMGVELEEAARQFSNFRPALLRTELEEVSGIRMVKDCYNSSPTAVIQALTSLRDIGSAGGGRLVALLGDMLELGTFEERYHKAVGQTAASIPLDLVVTVGERARVIHSVVKDAGLPCRHCEDATEAGRYLAQSLRPKDTVLVKGSRLMRLENAIDTFRQSFGVAGAGGHA